ncbi:homocysteine-responsive endoplasmic reticulum-resident ubiquitin-like domain member 2 protein [Anopheles ziemanni]|uniref:homocysteine-responsive endoplasmic reticulum-resident ubiquitin-like domain member 2 protein n=1 Tax=Anopheles coustani TaxID=139045 RepID=UPI002658CAB5|nr:homocysteine-responsive endoplasmic reticulum-resident ubiquitin-like domain member 2 protein [Anopheles coustani]XP_058173617.1 homocysteine-responsive endoplasmic reticulum-resident ubiquitin-like domain member 2 protein [Anopheles ziemanni]
MDVTLIVKASNQQCEDLTIKCEPSWTIRRLKGHLTEVYPGKPSSDEQKLIYSGQLLSDSVVLKDVLRQYDGQQAHTVHLVFTPKNSYYGNGGSSSSASKSNRNTNGGNKMASANSTSTSGASSSRAASSNSPGSSNNNETTSNDSVTGGGSSREHEGTSMVDGVGSDGLRHRTVLQTRPGLRTLPGPPPFMEQTVAMQNLMQQTYMQYLNQYINMINEQGGINALYSATGVPPASGTAAAVNPLTGSPVFPSVPFVPVQPSAGTAGSYPNFAYYPCMTPPSSHVGGLPTATSIPTPIVPAAVSSGSAQPGTTTPGFLPSPAIPSTSTSTSQQTPTSLLSSGGVTAPSASSDASSSTAATTAQAAGTDTTAAVAPAQVAAPQDEAAAAVANAAPGRARRFPNIVVEEQENNDWLDVFFSMCRVGILMTVIYLYSSPMRCLTVLFIGVMLYLKKHLDRVYQAIDRRFTRLPAAQEGNAAQPAAAQPNNNLVPEQQGPPVRDGGATVNDQPVTTGGALSAASEAAARTDGAVAEGETVGTPSTSQSPAPVPRPRTGPASGTAEPNTAVPANNNETEQLLERPSTAATQSDSPSAEQPAAEGQRMTFNDMTSFLGTLVITFFTSIIPDTPAA